MANLKKENPNTRIIAIPLGDDYYEVLKDKYSFSIYKRNSKGNVYTMGSYPSTFGRALEVILTDASNPTKEEVMTIRQYINEIRSIYDLLREVKAEWQIIDKKPSDGRLGIPELPPIEEQVEEEEEDEF